MASFIRPENALKQAENLIAVNHKDQALQTLHDVITSKRRTWSKVLEDIMKKYVQLCVELRKGKFAKEGLHQYKLTCQVNYNSLEVVIKHFLVLAESQAKEAQSKAKQTILDIEDLEAEESAESLILTAVSGEDRTDRTDREIVTPWLRFLWETYRTVLETLRNNAKLESLYHETAQAAFNFCLHYQRKNEFRRLSDILRNHLSNLGKYPNQPQNINLSNPETLKVHLVTRFTQLNVATELELWQEAFRSVEDIHGLMTMAHKPLTPEMTSTYFQRLARIFLVSNNHLFHAYAWFKYFAIARNQLKDRTEYTTMASSVLLAALSIPLSDPKQADEQYFEYDLQKEKNLRMGTLLGFASTPKREVLLQDLVSKNIHRTVFPELQDIYEILEKKFNPLSLCKKMAEKFAFIKTKPELAIYEEQLQKLTFLRLIQQLSQVYESMNISEFKGMISFMDSHTIEKLLVSAVKRKFAGVRIDHQNGAIHFGGNESEKLRDQLTQLAKGLQQASVMINPKPRENEVYVKTKREAFVKIVDSLKDMFAYFHNRRTIIEKRKFEVESNNLEAERKRVREREAQEKAKAASDAKKAEKLRRDLAEKLRKKEEEEKARQTKIMQLKPYVPEEEIAKIANADDFISKKIGEERKKKVEKENALVNLATELTHRERALRENERALLVEQNERKKVEARETFIKQQEKYLTNHREQHTEDLAEKTRLTRMANARAQFEERVMSARRVQYEKLKADQERRLAEIKKEREEERAQIAQQEEERRAKIEEEKRQIEEREREKARLEEEKRQEEDARREKLAEQAELQRKREAEALQKRREEDEKAREAQRLKEEERRQAQPAREPAREASWRDNNNNRRDERPNDRFARDERPNDRFSRDERPRDFGSRDERPRGDGDRWARREEAPAPRRDDGPQRRDDGPSNDRWGSGPQRRDDGPQRRDDAPPRREDSNDRWGARRDDGPQRREDAPPRREDSARADGGDRWGSRRDDGPQRRDDAPPARREEREREERPTTERWGANRDRDAAPRREDSARADGGDRWGSRRDDGPQRREERPQREERREERPQREEQPQRSALWRREESDRAPERKQEERAPREEKPREVPAEKPAPVKREEESAPKKDDGFSTVASKRKGRK